VLRKIFLSYHFDEASKAMAAKVEDLIRSFNILAVTGEHIGGGNLSAQIKADIEDCDALIYVLSKREPGRTNDWVMDEVSTAISFNKPLFGLIEEGINIPSPLTGREYFQYRTSEDANLWLKLCATLNIWIRRKGRSIFAIIQPEGIVNELRGYGNLDTLKVEYQLQNRQYKKSDWKMARISKTVAGVSVFLNEVLDGHSVILRIQTPNKTWESIPVNQELIIKLS